ncbi:hypothetical protein IFM89_027662 [Coptis chinensis]|uniref:Uncharacterized protein n=1 Tax=Coptis chinensis TaxID=261450 RepID=A0A835MAZ1_9MAGN|nr:hypothetical protein IFM89_027662 [Coptis chinensis]
MFFLHFDYKLVSYGLLQLENYAKTEEAKVEELIKAIRGLSAKVVVDGAAIGEMALHFCERYKLMVLKISSKFELRRFCRITGAVALLKLSQPNPNDLGYRDSISREEVGGSRCIALVLQVLLCNVCCVCGTDRKFLVLLQEGQAVQKLLSDCRSKEDMLKQVEEGWCDSQGTLHEIRTKLQIRQEGAVKNFYVNHFVAECLSNKNGAVLD